MAESLFVFVCLWLHRVSTAKLIGLTFSLTTPNEHIPEFFPFLDPLELHHISFPDAHVNLTTDKGLLIFLYKQLQKNEVYYFKFSM